MKVDNAIIMAAGTSSRFAPLSYESHKAMTVVKGWGFTLSLFCDSGWLIPTVAVAVSFATVSYLFYYKAISQIGASKSMALNVTYSAWAVIISIIFLRNYSLLNPVTIVCTFSVILFGILTGIDYKDLVKKN